MNEPFNWTLDHWPVALLALGPAILNLIVFGVVLIFAKRNALTYTFAAFVLSLTIWQFSDALIRFSATSENAQFWARLFGLGALLIAPAGMEFALQFTGRGHLVRTPKVLLGLWTPPVLIEASSRAGLNEVPLVPNATWVWMGAGPTPLVTKIYGVWIATLSIGILIVLAHFAWTSPASDPRRRPALLVALGFSVPTLQGTVTEVIFPTFLGLPNFPIASTMMTTFSVATFVALRRFEFLSTRSVEDQLADAERELARERRILEQAEQIAHLGSWDWDLATGTITWSAQMYQLFGVDRNTFRPSPGSIQAQVHNEDRGWFVKAVQDTVRSGSSLEFEHRIVRPNGDVRWVAAHGQVKRDDTGSPIRLFGTSQDITERRKAQGERQELERLRAVDEFKTQFLSMAAHELNTPLTPIMAQLYMLHLQDGKVTPESRRRSLDILDRNLRRLGSLVTDLLEAARIQSGRLKIVPRPTRIAPLVDEVVDAFASLAQGNGIHFQGHTVGDPVACIDSTRFSQVLYNLVSNAMKFTPRGGRVRVECRADGPYIECNVVDTGEGLDPDQMGRLFQPFSRVHELTGTNVNGTGLGLYISKTIVELHAGTLNVVSPGRGKGATFTVRVPSVDSSKSPSPSEAESNPVSTPIMA